MRDRYLIILWFSYSSKSSKIVEIDSGSEKSRFFFFHFPIVGVVTVELSPTQNKRGREGDEKKQFWICL